MTDVRDLVPFVNLELVVVLDVVNSGLDLILTNLFEVEVPENWVIDIQVQVMRGADRCATVVKDPDVMFSSKLESDGVSTVRYPGDTIGPHIVTEKECSLLACSEISLLQTLAWDGSHLPEFNDGVVVGDDTGVSDEGPFTKSSDSINDVLVSSGRGKDIFGEVVPHSVVARRVLSKGKGTESTGKEQLTHYFV